MTPHKLTWRIALAIALLCTAILLGYQYFNDQLDLPFVCFLFLLVLIANYSLLRFFLERFIYRKLKPIYKLLSKQGTSGRSKITGEEFTSDVIGKLDHDVKNWAYNKEKEIASLKSLEQYRKDYLGNISHELKTPIFAIQGYIHTLIEDVGSKKQEKRFLKRTAVNVERLVNIVNDLELISKLEDGTKLLNKTTFDIYLLVEEVYLDLELHAKEMSITLGFKPKDSGEKRLVFADRESIRTVLVNLIVNAIKYGKEGGSVKTGFYEMDTRLLIEISDDGIGVAEQHTPHLFDRFYRVEKSRNRDVAGSGLGLAIVKHLIEAHNQEINVISKVDEGTSFRFTLPMV